MISLIAAMTKKHVIGKDNKLLWNIAQEMDHFKSTTQGNVVIMGRKTFESIGRPLPKRHNIVITSSAKHIDGVEIAHSIDEALVKAKKHHKDIFVIGGAQIYEQFLPHADTMHLSFVKKEYEGDAYFPHFDEKRWHITESLDYPEFELRIYKKTQ